MIAGVYLPRKPPGTQWDVHISEDGCIASINPHQASSESSAEPQTLDGTGRFLAPSLCHAHIHLDKYFLLQDPKYDDLQLDRGDFNEAHVNHFPSQSPV